MTSRELVYATLEFRNPPRAPRQLRSLPWAALNMMDDWGTQTTLPVQK